MQKPYLLFLLFTCTLCVAQKAEYAENVFINGHNNLKAYQPFGYNSINSLLGKPDSIVHAPYFCGSYFAVDDSLAYYGNLILEKNKDTMGFRSIDFNKDKHISIVFSKMKLTASTTMDEVKALFVISSRDTAAMNNVITGKSVKLLSIEIHPKRNDNEQWYLWFCDDKLLRLELWHGC